MTHPERLAAGLSMVKCPHCPRELGDENAAYQHIKCKHHGKPNPYHAACTSPTMRGGHGVPSDSMADLFIEGEINRAMGVPNPEWLEDMLP